MDIDLKSLTELHREVISAWQAVGRRLPQLGIVDRAVACIQLEARANRLATQESFVDGAIGLSQEARSLEQTFKDKNPKNLILAIAGVVGTVLSILGLSVIDLLLGVLDSAMETVESAGTMLASGLVTIALPAVALVYIVRGIYMAVQKAAESVNNILDKDYASTAALRASAEAEQRLFQMLGEKVPHIPISPGPIILLLVAGMIFGLLVVALAFAGG
ncbi:MAG TPA: hypothetical protein VF635_08305 [Propionibacteriaceae bacterium]